VFGMRSRLGLHGNTLNVDAPAWERQDSGTGAGIDSFYEYLLKVCSASCFLRRVCGVGHTAVDSSYDRAASAE